MNKNLIITTSFGAGLLIGAAIGTGYALITRKKFEAEFEKRLEEDIAQYKSDWERMQLIKKPYADPTEAAKALIPEEKNYKPGRLPAPGVPVEEAKSVVSKIFEYGGSEDPEDPELLELVESGQVRRFNAFDEPERSADKPYIISIDEFAEDNLEDGTPLDKYTITYYEGDDVLVDERDQLIPQLDETVGSINLTMFGSETKKYSQDPNIVYVRNEKLRADFEIALAKGSWAAHLMGVDPDELEEADRRQRPKRMRDDG